MADQGSWDDYQNQERQIVGSTIHFGPVFRGEVFQAWCPELHGMAWRCLLNGEALGAYQSIEAAKARIDWEVWNRTRQMAAGYRLLLSRRVEWESGNG